MHNYVIYDLDMYISYISDVQHKYKLNCFLMYILHTRNVYLSHIAGLIISTSAVC